MRKALLFCLETDRKKEESPFFSKKAKNMLDLPNCL